MSAPVYLNACAACGAHPSASLWVTETDARSPDGCFYCPKCRPGLMDGAAQLDPAVRHDARLHLYGEPSFREFIPVGDLDDTGHFPCAVLGRPDLPTWPRHVSDIMPRFSYSHLAKARAAR